MVATWSQQCVWYVVKVSSRNKQGYESIKDEYVTIIESAKALPLRKWVPRAVNRCIRRQVYLKILQHFPIQQCKFYSKKYTSLSVHQTNSPADDDGCDTKSVFGTSAAGSTVTYCASTGAEWLLCYWYRRTQAQVVVSHRLLARGEKDLIDTGGVISSGDW